MFRRIEAGGRRGHATRTTFVLRLGGEVRLEETDETLAKRVTLVDADRDAAWTVRARHQYRGTRRSAADGFDLELTSPDAQPLALHCAEMTVEVGAAGAVPVSTPEIADDAPCDGTTGWSLAGTSPVRVVACAAAGQAAADVDADDRLVFAAPPGIEWVDDNSVCGPHGGLRRAAR